MAQQRSRAVERPARQRQSGPGVPRRGTGPAVDNARLREIVEAAAGLAGYDLESLSVRRLGRRHVVQIVVDGDDGVDLDRVAELSRRISAELDAAEAGGDEVIPGEYDLEVGSPGVDRPLTAPRHWRRNRGRLVQVRTGQGQVTGRVTEVDDGGVVLDIDGTPQRFALADLGPGRVQVEFSRLAEDDNEIDDEGIDDKGKDEE